MGKIESIGEDIKFLMLAQGVTDDVTSRTITPVHPCCSKEELEQLNESLTNDDKFQSLVSVLFVIFVLIFRKLLFFQYLLLLLYLLN